MPGLGPGQGLARVACVLTATAALICDLVAHVDMLEGGRGGVYTSNTTTAFLDT